MKMDHEKKDTGSCEEISAAIHEVICNLLGKNMSASSIAVYLTHHATQLSFASCDDPTRIFKTILGAMLQSIPEKEEEFDEKLVDKITHYQASFLTN